LFKRVNKMKPGLDASIGSNEELRADGSQWLAVVI
jgi:hypothetical protein